MPFTGKEKGILCVRICLNTVETRLHCAFERENLLKNAPTAMQI